MTTKHSYWLCETSGTYAQQFQELTTSHLNQNRKIELGNQIGAAGGEGAAFELIGSPQTLAKIYHSNNASARQEKVAAMIASELHKKLNFSAMPIQAVVDDNGSFAGFTMQRVQQAFQIHQLYNLSDRQNYFPNSDYRFLVRAAHNLAQAFTHLHYENLVIGDVNESGIFYSTGGWVKLIDCDSFQAELGGTFYPCMVRVPEYTPSELHGQDTSKIKRTANHDNFALAVMIFRLLMLGQHPYTARFTGTGDSPTQSSRVRNFEYAYDRNTKGKNYGAPSHALNITSFPDPIITAFEIAFGAQGLNGRPTAADWSALLQDFDQALTTCPTNPSHQHLSVFSACPLCSLEVTQNVRLFGNQPSPSFSGAAAYTHVNTGGGAATASPQPQPQPQFTHQYQSVSAPQSAPPSQPKQTVQKSTRSVSVFESFKLFFYNYASFFGRSCRSAFWWPFLAFVVTYAALIVNFAPQSLNFDQYTTPAQDMVGLFVLALYLPMIAVAARRLHDVGRSAFWLLLVPISLIIAIAINVPILGILGFLPLFYWFVKRGIFGANKHGDDVEEGQQLKNSKNIFATNVLRRLIALFFLTIIPINLLGWTMVYATEALGAVQTSNPEIEVPSIGLILAAVICFAIMLFSSILFKFIVNWKNSHWKRIDIAILGISLIVFSANVALPDTWLSEAADGIFVKASPDEEFFNDVVTVLAATIGCISAFFKNIKRIFK